MITDGQKSSIFGIGPQLGQKYVRDLTQLRSYTLYADIKSEIRNEASSQGCYGCSHLFSGARESKLVKSVYICTIQKLATKQSEITS